MNRTIYIGTRAYEKHTFLIETAYLAELEQQAQEEGTTLTELLNKIFKDRLNDEQNKKVSYDLNSGLNKLNRQEAK
ncbi:hypothetical protein D9M68_643500 [compost metagenome]